MSPSLEATAAGAEAEAGVETDTDPDTLVDGDVVVVVGASGRIGRLVAQRCPRVLVIFVQNKVNKLMESKE